MARGRPRRPPLTRDQILEAAFQIAHDEGLAALSMRRLAKELGIEASSLYHYVASRDEVLDGIVARLRRRVAVPEQIPQDWATAMEALFAAYAEVLTAHPNLVPLAGRQVDDDPETNGLMWLVEHGFSLDDATELWQCVHALTIGFALLASSQVRIDTADLSPAVADRFRDWRPETYRRGLRLLIDGHGVPTTQARPPARGTGADSPDPGASSDELHGSVRRPSSPRSR